jgi:hypothetical protein
MNRASERLRHNTKGGTLCIALRKFFAGRKIVTFSEHAQRRIFARDFSVVRNCDCDLGVRAALVGFMELFGIRNTSGKSF